MAYKNSVFLNVPFDPRYKRLFEAAVFAIYDCGFIARCAKEEEDSSQIRVEKIYELIEQSKYGIHDISRVTLDSKNRLPRFNMPLELGFWLGARQYGTKNHRQKRALVLDKEDFRYQKFCSDIAGQDIRAHKNNVDIIITKIRNWLRNSPDYKDVVFPSAEKWLNAMLYFERNSPPNVNWKSLTRRSWSSTTTQFLL